MDKPCKSTKWIISVAIGKYGGYSNLRVQWKLWYDNHPVIISGLFGKRLFIGKSILGGEFGPEPKFPYNYDNRIAEGPGSKRSCVVSTLSLGKGAL